MGIINFLFGQNEAREGNYHPSAYPPKWLVGRPETTAGTVVTVDTANAISATYACVKRLSESIAKLPLDQWIRNGKKTSIEDSDLNYLLRWQPNKWMTSVVWRTMMMRDFCLRGNAYSQIQRSNGGKVLQLIPLDPDKMKVTLGPNQELIYTYTAYNRRPENYRADEIVHIKNMSADGLVGRSPIEECRDVFGLTIAAEEYGARTFKHDATPRGIVEIPGKLSKDRRDELEGQLTEKLAGVRNAGKFTIFEAGTKFHQISMTPEDAQFILVRKFQAEEICRIYGVPPHMIGILDKATFSNIEHQRLEYLGDTLVPIIEIFQQELQTKLLTRGVDAKRYIEFNVDSFLRGDSKTQAEVDEIKIRSGTRNPNEARALNGEDPYDGGEIFVKPTAPQQAKGTDNNNKENDSKEEPEEEEKDDRHKLIAGVQFMNLYLNQTGRAAARETKAMAGHDTETKSKKFWEGEIRQLNSTIWPVFAAHCGVLGQKLEQIEGKRAMVEQIILRYCNLKAPVSEAQLASEIFKIAEQDHE